MKTQRRLVRDKFPNTATVFLRKLEYTGRWALDRWVLENVALIEPTAEHPRQSDRETESLYVWSGLDLVVESNRCEGYYQNLLSEQHKLFVICRMDERRILQPLLISLDCDEAAVHMEADDTVFPHPLPESVIGWLEKFVLEYYRPEPRQKRKREDWKD